MDITPAVPEGSQVITGYGPGLFRIAGVAHTGSRIDCRFKDLGKIGYTYEESLDDFDFEIGNNYFDKAMEDFFETPETPSEEKTHEEIIKEEYDACLDELNKIFAGDKEKYEHFLTMMLDNDYCPIATAKALGVTTARISQIVKKFKHLMEHNKSNSLAA